ncbi:MAG: hypothetical protein M1830_006051 [Pleopsidium flavum]|nr:MAG: hypothetical protein M1830_006078 [Pleopsidium flavum]KAI9876629.1 MAG: hypothetical protein M1830_006051 [Pleopsidium flavum]
MSSGFVSTGTTEQPIERDDEWLKAQQEIEATRRRKAEESRQDGGKTLYDTLQANKAAKQEAFEEAIRLKNQFRSLDEDEIEFLDSVLESTRTKEAAVKKETIEQLDLFRRQQEEADKAWLAEAADGSGTNVVAGSSSIEEEQWIVNGKKRKRAKDKQVLKGVKLRKTSSTSDKPAEPIAKAMSPMLTPNVTPDELGTVQEISGVEDTKTARSQSAGRRESAGLPTVSAVPTTAATQSASKGLKGLGLDDYSSDGE